MEPSDVDTFMQTVSHALISGIIHVVEMAYRWHRNRTAPYYLPPLREQEEAQPKEEPYHEV